MMGQLSFEGIQLHRDIQRQGYALIEHSVPAEAIDALIKAYAKFTDELPDPTLEDMNLMIADPNDLDKLNYAVNPASPWNKYHTNYPEFGKPGGYTNRSLQTASLRKFDRKLGNAETEELREPEDDPKEYYHFHPNSTVMMKRAGERYGWGPLPPEVHALHERFALIHQLSAQAIAAAYQGLEDTHPDLLPKHFSRKDVQSSPVRLLFYHLDQGDVLAAGHYDKASATIQIAESHLGLWIRDPQTGLLKRPPEQGVFFLGKTWNSNNSYPNSELKPTWHGVINQPERAEGRTLHGRNVARWAIIFFANSLAAGVVNDKRLTHAPKQLVA